MWSLPTFFPHRPALRGRSWFDLPTSGRVTIGATYGSIWEEWATRSPMLMPTLAFTRVLAEGRVHAEMSQRLDVFSDD